MKKNLLLLIVASLIAFDVRSIEKMGKRFPIDESLRIKLLRRLGEKDYNSVGIDSRSGLEISDVAENPKSPQQKFLTHEQILRIIFGEPEPEIKESGHVRRPAGWRLTR